MSKIFNNIPHSATEPQPMDGWFRTTPYDATRIRNIVDTIGGGQAVTKMGTSIPTPFARLVLFDTAFAQIRNHDDDTVYGRLVSECLDMLEFVFNYGSDITVQRWNVNTQLQALQASPNAKHKELGKSLTTFVHELGVQDIFLLYYQGQLVGGTSPYTVLYTSPNWSRSNVLTFQGIAGNPLFPDYANRAVHATPLYKRDRRFREFLTDYIVAFRGALDLNVSAITQGAAQNALKRYVYDNAHNGQDTEMQAYYTQITGQQPMSAADFMQKYDMVKDNIGTGLDVKGLGHLVMPVAYAKMAAPAGQGGAAAADMGGVVSTDYALQPTTERWRTQHPELSVAPLVLSEGGVMGALYIGGNAWTPGTPINNDPSQPLAERVLPGAGNVTYPYVTAEDFLEDALICVDYDLDDQAFRTCGLGHYLPPLKPLFFEFFSPADLQAGRQVSITINEQPQGGAEVVLRLPIDYKGQPFIELKKTYDAGSVMQAIGPMGFCFSVFPSYKIVGAPSVPNRYSVMRYEDKDAPLQLTYWTADDHALTQLAPDEVHHQTRDTLGMSYDAIDSGFDLIQVSWQGANAMIAPNFREVQPADRGTTTLVGIDFGTTNTYVCLSFQQGANPMALTFTPEHRQTLTLGNTQVPTFMQAAEREFAPALIGPGCKACYPYRTVIYENPQTMANQQRALHDFRLFADANVGFNFMSESIPNLGGKYESSIKWDMENSNNPNQLTIMQNRVEAFCRQTAWMLKNRLMAEPAIATTNFTAKLTMPYTMRRQNRRNILQAWKNAFDYVMGPGNVTVEHLTESVAPYYYMIGNNVTMNGNVINVDVGGGTTDILYADVKKHRLLYDSSHFAGDDIWGDGPKNVADQETLPQDRNGFIRLFEQLMADGNFPEAEKDAYNNFKQNAKKASDRMAYVFYHDDIFSFTNHVRNTPKLTAVLHLHLAALCCHIAQTIVKEQMELPRILCFSGQGSKYIKLISDLDEDITELVKLYLETFLPEGTELERQFEVMFQQNSKEVTAQGALFESNSALAGIRDFDRDAVVVSGLEGKDPETYEEADQPEVKEEARAAYEKFVQQYLRNDKVRKYLKTNYDVDFNDEFVHTFKDAFDDGYADVIQKACNGGGSPTDELSESVFFWPFKKALYECSKL